MGSEPATQAEHDPLAALLGGLPAPALLVELGTARLLFANRAADRMAGGEFPLDAPPRVFDASGRPLAPPEFPRSRVARGERFTGYQVDWELPSGRRTVVASGDIAVLPGGEAVGVLTFEDITGIEAERRRAALLADAAATLSAAALDVRATMQAIAELAVPSFADVCVVALVADDGQVERTAAVAADPDRAALIHDGNGRYPFTPNGDAGSAQVLRTGEAQLSAEITADGLEAAAQDGEHLALLRALAPRSAIIVPLRARGRVLGHLTFVVTDSGRRYDEGDLTAALDLADRCAAYIDNAALHASLRATETELRRSRDELKAILEGVADSITVQAPDGRLVYANEAAVRSLGFASAEELISSDARELMRRFAPVDDDGRPFPIERLPGRRALLGEEPEPVTVRYRAPHEDVERWSRVKARPVRDDDGTVRLAINLIEDITEIKASEQAHRFLAETSRALAASLDYDTTLRTVSELAVPELADWCFVDLRTSEGLERVAVAFAAGVPAPEAAASMHGAILDLRADRGPARVVRTGRPELYEHVTDADLARAAPNPGHLEVLRGLAVRSAMVVPMIVRHKVLGAITMLTTTPRAPLSRLDLAIGEELGRRAAVAVDAARLHRASSAIAQTLQASLLPPVLPEVPGLRTGALYRAAADGVEVGGDFYDVFSVAEDQWFAVIGDVCGKGAEAAAVTALARYTIRAVAVQRRSPAAILRLLGDAMLRQADAGGGRFCTIACVRLDVGGDRVRATAACGGHPLPAIVRAGGEIEELGRPGTLIGLTDEPDVADRATDLAPGDTLVLYTDGLTEARAPTLVWTPADLAAALAAARSDDPQVMLERLAAAATDGRAAPMRDDLALLALRVGERPR